jgi:hypothetical protein
MPVVDTEALRGLLRRVPGLRAALLLDPAGAAPLVRAARDPAEDLRLVAVRAARLLDALSAAGQAPPTEVVVEAERASLLLLTVPDGTLCLVLEPGASSARAAFEARRALHRRAV